MYELNYLLLYPMSGLFHNYSKDVAVHFILFEQLLLNDIMQIAHVYTFIMNRRLRDHRS